VIPASPIRPGVIVGDNREQPFAATTGVIACLAVLVGWLLWASMGVAQTRTPVNVAGEAHWQQSAQGQQVMVVTAHPLATRVGVELLTGGGNAVDAAVAVALALAVVEPYSSGLGGGGFALVFTAADTTVRSLDFRETAPGAATRDMFLVAGQVDPELSRTGALAVAVPGLISGLAELHRAHGSLPWRRLVTPAVELAQAGFPVTAPLRERIEFHAPRFNAAARRIFLPHDELPGKGHLLRQEDLARTLALIARDGPAAFSSGEVAELMVAAVRREGGLMTLADLAAYRPVWRETVSGDFHGLTIHAMAPPSSGGVHLVQMLNILSAYDLSDLYWREEIAEGEYFKYASVPGCHRLIETMKFAFADRSRWLGDPDYVSVPQAWLLSTDRADSQRSCIQAEQALPWDAIPGAKVLPATSDHTSHLSIVDAQGNAVAMTLTINLNFGAGLVAEGTGVLLNDEMDDFVAAPGAPNAFGLVGGEENAVAPGKRPLSSMTPTLALAGGSVVMVAGGPGGSRIITSVLQVVVNLIAVGMDVVQAVRAPRLHHQWYPPQVYFESDGMTSGCQAGLRALGHELTLREPMGNVQAIWVDPLTTVRYGASDPRGMGAAAGY
jgi:gamma-glutamyltranspeptidase/glutathione hydrolase